MEQSDEIGLIAKRFNYVFLNLEDIVHGIHTSTKSMTQDILELDELTQNMESLTVITHSVADTASATGFYFFLD